MPQLAGDTAAPKWRPLRCLKAVCCCPRMGLRLECGTRMRPPLKAVNPAARAAARATAPPQALATLLQAREPTAAQPARRASTWSFYSARIRQARITVAMIRTARTATPVPAEDRRVRLRLEPRPVRRQRAGHRALLPAQVVRRPRQRPAPLVRRCPAFRSPLRINRETS